VTDLTRSRPPHVLLTVATLLATVVCARPVRAQDTASATFAVPPDGIDVTVRPDWLQIVARRDSFRVLIQGTPVGSQVVTVARTGDSLVLDERTVIPFLDLRQQTRVVMDAWSLAPWSVEQSGNFGTQKAETHVVFVNGWVHGRAQTPQPGGEPRVTAIDTTFPPGALDVNQLRLAVPLLPLVEGTDLVLHVFNAADASLRPYTLRAVSDTTTPADSACGEVYRVVILGGEPQRLTVCRGLPRHVVRVESVGQPLVFELVQRDEQSGGQ
jgi:hypothetical protein